MTADPSTQPAGYPVTGGSRLGDTRDVGLNPFRAQRRRRSDYVLVAATLAVILAMIVWAAH